MARQLVWIWTIAHIMSKWILVICLVFGSTYIFSQKVEVSKEKIILPEGFMLDVSLSNSNQFSHTGWLPGTFYYPNGTSRDYEQIKFNQFDSQIKVMVKGAEIDVLPTLLTGLVIRVSDVLGHVYVVLEYDGETSFYEVLSNGEHILLSSMKLKEPEKEDGNKLGVTLRFEEKEKIVDVEEKWFVLDGGSPEPLKTNQKGVAKATGVDKKIIETYVGANNLILSNRHQLAQLFDYINTL